MFDEQNRFPLLTGLTCRAYQKVSWATVSEDAGVMHYSILILRRYRSRGPGTALNLIRQGGYLSGHHLVVPPPQALSIKYE